MPTLAMTRSAAPLVVDRQGRVAVLVIGRTTYATGSGGRVDLRTGEVWAQSAIEDALEAGEDDEEDPERWLWIEGEGSRAGYRDMELFIAGIDDPDTADLLSIAITGRGAFRRFKDLLTRYPNLEDRWYAYSEDRQRGRA